MILPPFVITLKGTLSDAFLLYSLLAFSMISSASCAGTSS